MRELIVCPVAARIPTADAHAHAGPDQRERDPGLVGHFSAMLAINGRRERGLRMAVGGNLIGL